MRLPYIGVTSLISISIFMNENGIIELEGMEFKAYHGCLEKEKIEGNLFVVDFRGETSLYEAAVTDNLCSTVNYAEIYNLVAEEMAVPSDLLENVAGRIVMGIEKKFPQFTSFSVRVSKRRPPVEGIAQWSRITLFHDNKNLL